MITGNWKRLPLSTRTVWTGFVRSAVLTVVLGQMMALAAARDARAQQVPGVRGSAGQIAQLKFDAVSIRQSPPATSYSQFVSNPSHRGSLDATDIWVNQLVAGAYGVNFRTQLSGGPDWVGQQRFVIHARSSAEVDGLLAGMKDAEANEAKQAMLRAMLADRFGLRAHIDMRPTTVYTLTLAKGSPSLKVSAAGATDQEQLGVRSSGDAHGIRLVAHQVTMETLAGQLGFYLKTEVLDRTGLTQPYDFDLSFNPNPDQQADSPNGPPPAEVALPEQLGLKLTRGKAPVKILVIDALTEPTPN